MDHALEIKKYLPHDGPMLLIDRLIEVNDKKATTEVHISEKSQFYENGQVPGWIGIEYMAQTIAILGGHLGQKLGEERSIGFLLGVRKYKSSLAGFPKGIVLTIEAVVDMIYESMGSFDVTISVSGKPIAQSRMTTFKPSPAMIEKLKSGEEIG